MTLHTDDPRQEELVGLLNAFIDAEPRLEIWRHYPDITEAQDEYTDAWACVQVSAEFAEFARGLGWDAAVLDGIDPEHPFAFDHAWVRLTRSGRTYDVDWTARQFHNLHAINGRDPAVMALPWPLIWDPAAVGKNIHPVVGEFAAVTKNNSRDYR